MCKHVNQTNCNIILGYIFKSLKIFTYNSRFFLHQITYTVAIEGRPKSCINKEIMEKYIILRMYFKSQKERYVKYEKGSYCNFSM